MTLRGDQKRWTEADAIEQFAHKTANDFFRSETYFLERIATEIDSVLDIGCAAGRMIELFARYGVKPRFTGIDLSPASIALARKNYPDSNFIDGDALDCEFGEPFALVNATGVFQHEQRFEALLDRMLYWSSRYVLFDVKLAAIDSHLIDIERSYCGGADRLFYIVLSPRQLLSKLRSLPGLSRISIYGYETPTNARTFVPGDLGPITSAGILLEKGPASAPELQVALPDSLSAKLAGST